MIGQHLYMSEKMEPHLKMKTKKGAKNDSQLKQARRQISEK